MATYIRNGVRTDAGESMGEFQQRQQIKRIARRGLSRSEKRAVDTATAQQIEQTAKQFVAQPIDVQKQVISGGAQKYNTQIWNQYEQARQKYWRDEVAYNQALRDYSQYSNSLSKEGAMKAVDSLITSAQASAGWRPPQTTKEKIIISKPHYYLDKTSKYIATTGLKAKDVLSEFMKENPNQKAIRLSKEWNKDTPLNNMKKLGDAIGRQALQPAEGALKVQLSKMYKILERTGVENKVLDLYKQIAKKSGNLAKYDRYVEKYNQVKDKYYKQGADLIKDPQVQSAIGLALIGVGTAIAPKLATKAFNAAMVYQGVKTINNPTADNLATMSILTAGTALGHIRGAKLTKAGKAKIASTTKRTLNKIRIKYPTIQRRGKYIKDTHRIGKRNTRLTEKVYTALRHGRPKKYYKLTRIQINKALTNIKGFTQRIRQFKAKVNKSITKFEKATGRKLREYKSFSKLPIKHLKELYKLNKQLIIDTNKGRIKDIKWMKFLVKNKLLIRNNIKNYLITRGKHYGGRIKDFFREGADTSISPIKRIKEYIRLKNKSGEPWGIGRTRSRLEAKLQLFKLRNHKTLDFISKNLKIIKGMPRQALKDIKTWHKYNKATLDKAIKRGRLFIERNKAYYQALKEYGKLGFNYTLQIAKSGVVKIGNKYYMLKGKYLTPVTRRTARIIRIARESAHNLIQRKTVGIRNLSKASREAFFNSMQRLDKRLQYLVHVSRSKIPIKIKWREFKPFKSKVKYHTPGEKQSRKISRKGLYRDIIDSDKPRTLGLKYLESKRPISKKALLRRIRQREGMLGEKRGLIKTTANIIEKKRLLARKLAIKKLEVKAYKAEKKGSKPKTTSVDTGKEIVTRNKDGTYTVHLQRLRHKVRDPKGKDKGKGKDKEKPRIIEPGYKESRTFIYTPKGGRVIEPRPKSLGDTGQFQPVREAYDQRKDEAELFKALRDIIISQRLNRRQAQKMVQRVATIRSLRQKAVEIPPKIPIIEPPKKKREEKKRRKRRTKDLYKIERIKDPWEWGGQRAYTYKQNLALTRRKGTFYL